MLIFFPFFADLSFPPFSNIMNLWKWVGTGTGKKSARINRWAYPVESKPQKGTTFTVFMPIAENVMDMQQDRTEKETI